MLLIVPLSQFVRVGAGLALLLSRYTRPSPRRRSWPVADGRSVPQRIISRLLSMCVCHRD
jgi:hypothetical protein